MMETRALCKKYGKKTVVNDVSLHLETTAYGLLGPNGAGKTTLLRLLAGVIRADGGEIHYPEDCACIGYLPQKFGCFPELTVYEQMEYFACLKKIPAREQKDEIDKALCMVHLDDLRKTKCRKLSGGMVRRVGIAQAVIGRPRLILFDEPTVGLDVEERVRFIQVVEELGGQAIVLLSTHLVEDVKSACKKVIIMNRGDILSEESASGTAELAKGRVFQVRKEELEHIPFPFYVEKYENIEDTVYARILMETAPGIAYSACVPDLEDGYFWKVKMDGDVMEV